MAVLDLFFTILEILVFFGAIVVVFFLWINHRDLQKEEESYQEGFSHHQNIHKQYRQRHVEQEAPPEESLRHYRVVHHEERKAQKQQEHKAKAVKQKQMMMSVEEEAKKKVELQKKRLAEKMAIPDPQDAPQERR